MIGRWKRFWRRRKHVTWGEYLDQHNYFTQLVEDMRIRFEGLKETMAWELKRMRGEDV